jgi:hypothetical protein
LGEVEIFRINFYGDLAGQHHLGGECEIESTRRNIGGQFHIVGAVEKKLAADLRGSRRSLSFSCEAWCAGGSGRRGWSASVSLALISTCQAQEMQKTAFSS